MRMAVVAVVLVLVLAPGVYAARDLVVPANSVTTVQIRNGTILPADLSRQTVAWLNASAPTPRGRGLSVQRGQNGDKITVTGATIASDGDMLAQMTYAGGLSCSSLGPWLEIAVTFFNATGLIVDTGTETETRPVPGVRYPVEVTSLAQGVVRAEAVASVTCL